MLTRRASLLLPLAVAACAETPPARDYPPLSYSYLPPLRLNVASIDVEQRFVPTGAAPDVSPVDPVRPVDALRAMAEDRLKAFGSAGRATLVINDASLTSERRRDHRQPCRAARYLRPRRRAGWLCRGPGITSAHRRDR